MATSANTTFVQNLYQNLLQRTGDTAGLDYWIARADGGMSAADMASAFIASPEAQNVTAVLHLYDVFFNRAADSAGLTYWVSALKSGSSLRDIANSFSASSEFQSKFAGTSTADYVEATYGNLFGRPSDAAGKAYWVERIESGSLTRAEVSLAFSLSTEALSSTGAATRFTESYLVLRAAGTAEPSTSAVETLAGKALTTALAEKVTSYTVGSGLSVTGKLVDGYIKDATVFADANGDGKWNEGEAKATTDAKGNFTLDGAKGAMVASGGTDLSTGKAFKGVLKATEGSTMINPLTSMQQAFVEKGLSVAAAEEKVAKALGLDASKFDLTTFDPLAASLDTNASAEDRALGAQLQAEAAKVANFIVAAGQTLTGAAGGADQVDALSLGDSMFDAMINAIDADSDGVVSLNDKSMLESIMNEAVTLSGDTELLAAADKVAGLADEFAAMSAAAADSVDKAFDAGGDIAAMMANIAQAQVVAQGDMADQMLEAAEGGNFTAIDDGFTGTAFDTAADKAAIGDLDPNSTTDDAAADASNSDADEADTTVTPTPTTPTTPTPEPEPEEEAASTVAYSGATLAEAEANNGSITAKLTLTLTGGETFTGSNDGVLAGAVVTNVPAGLMAVVTKKTSTTAELSFTGNATAHANAQDISNLTVTLGNAAFTGGSAAAVTGATKSDLTINFADAGFAVTDSGSGVYVVGTGHGNVVVADDGTNYVFTPASGSAVSVAKAGVNSIVVNTIILNSTAAVLSGETVTGTGVVVAVGMTSASDLHLLSATTVAVTVDENVTVDASKLPPPSKESLNNSV